MGDKVILMANAARPQPGAAQALGFPPVMLLARLLL